MRGIHLRISELLVFVLLFTTFPVLAESTDSLNGSGLIHSTAIENRNGKIEPIIVETVEEKISPELVTTNSTVVSYLVYMDQTANVEELALEASEAFDKQQNSTDSSITSPLQMERERKLACRIGVVQGLQETAQRSQTELIDWLQPYCHSGVVTSIQPFWIVNAIAITSDKSTLFKIASQPDVRKIEPIGQVELIDGDREPTLATPTATDPVEWGVRMVGSPSAWAMGYDGSGVVVATIDTGVDWTHPALERKFQAYTPSTASNLDANLLPYSWFDATANQSTTPSDTYGHGTHTMGTICGSSEDGLNQIGVAPGAKWISADAFEGNTASDTAVLTCGQWILAPGVSGSPTCPPNPAMAPDVVSNSWGKSAGFDEYYRGVVQAWRASGIFSIFAAGNDGPGSISREAGYPESFAVGAIDQNKDWASFSGRGPSAYMIWEPGPYYGQRVLKPDVVAPGVAIRSSFPNGIYGEMTGTSMAAPHAAGCVALLLSKNQNLTISDLELLITQTAEVRTELEFPDNPGYGYEFPDYPNYGYGWGIIDGGVATSLPTSWIHVTRPNISEMRPLGSSLPIRWTSLNVGGSVRIELSRDGGLNWETIISDTLNDGWEDWMIAGPCSTECRIRVQSNENPSIMDSSDQLFALYALQVTSPNGGEEWQIGSLQSITWLSENVPGMLRVEVNRKFPTGSWENIGVVPAASGSFPWTISGQISNESRVRLIHLNRSSINDISNGNVSLVAPDYPYLELLSPNGAEIWPIGSFQTIRWLTFNIVGYVRIELNREYPNGSWEIMGNFAASDGRATLPISGVSSPQCMIRVQSISEPSVSVLSNSTFSIVPAEPDASPWPMYGNNAQHTGQSAFAGPNYPKLAWLFPILAIRCSPVIDSAGSIYIIGGVPGTCQQALYSISPTGQLRWNYWMNSNGIAPAVSPDGIVFFEGRDNHLYAINPDGSFKWRFATGDGTEPFFVHYSSPTLGYNNTVLINTGKFLYCIDRTSGTLKWQAEMEGYGGWEVSAAVAPDGTIYCSSSGYLESYSPTGSLKWRFPNVGGTPAIAPDGIIYAISGVDLVAIDPQGVQVMKSDPFWPQSYRSSPTLGPDGTIYLSSGVGLLAWNSDGSLKWSYLADRASSLPITDSDGVVYYASGNQIFALNPNGTLRWKNQVSDAGTIEYLAIGANGVLYFGTFGGIDGLYALAPSPLQILRPNGEENWTVGTQQAITWTSTNLTGNLAITLSRDGGSTYTETIAASVPVSAGSYSWVVTGPVSTTCRIKVTSIADPSVSDTSNGDFIISVLPSIASTPTSFTFSCTHSQANPPPQILEVWNSGGATLNWSASEASPWLSLTPTSGSSTGEHDPVTVSVDASGLVAGTYTATITVISPEADNSPQIAQVTLNVAPHAVSIIDGPTATPSTIASSGSTNLSVSATDSLTGHSLSYTWSVVSSPIGNGSFSNPNTQNPTWTAPPNTTGSDVTVQFKVRATCTIDSNIYTEGTVNVVVQSVPPHLTLSPTSFTFSAAQGGANPSFRGYHAMAYDASAGKVILFGGQGSSGNLNDTWAYDYATNSWTNRGPVNPPPARHGHAMSYDASAGKVILFGGQGSSGNLNDTWAYDYATNSWTNRGPVNPPPARHGHAMSYDASAGKVILFGGYGVLNDTWAYDYASNIWTNLTPINPPPLRYGHALAYDASAGKVILFGGQSSSGSLNDTWAYDYASNSWTDRGPVNPPNQILNISNTGGDSLSWTASDNQTWLTLSLASGTAPGFTILSVNISGLSPGTYTTTVTVISPEADNSPQTAQVTLQVNPPTSKTVSYNLIEGWNMISLPVTPASTTPSVVFGGLLPGWVMYAWDATNGSYIGKDQIVLGLAQGYWLKVSEAVEYSVSGQPNEAAQTGIDLGWGWNLIGVPYEGAIPWGAVRASKDGGALVTLDDAIVSNWIQAIFFRWQGSAYQGLTTGGIFQPLSGYWVKTKVGGVRLVFMKP